MQFMIVAYDGKDPAAMERRMAARGAHLARVDQTRATGHLIAGGAILDDEDRMIGSTLYVEFESRAALDQWIAEDPYVTGDVWREIEVTPIRLARR